MSYDIQVYSILEPDPAELEVEREGAAFAYRRPAWQILVHVPVRVEAEDLPAGVASMLPGIQFEVLINVEGAAPDSARVKAKQFARRLAKSSLGVVVDLQDGTVSTPSGICRLPESEMEEGDDSPEVTLSWYFLDCAIDSRVTTFVEIIERHIPEALPRRYGDFEPPQFKFKSEGREHFLGFLRANLNRSIVWYPSDPFSDVSIHVPPESGPTNQGFRVGYAHLSLSGATIQKPGWRVALERAWLEIARLFGSFYAEIRIGAPPISVWWWNGIPSQAGVEAVAVGPPYLELWSTFAAASQSVRHSELRYLSKPTNDPPIEIAQPSEERIERDPRTGEVLSIYRYASIQYPKIWPFAGPRSETRA